MTRLLLAGILACLIVLIVQGLSSDARPGPGAPPEAGDVGRYRVTTTRAGTPLLIRTDTVTGRVWKLELRGGRDRWLEFREPGAEPPRESAPDAAEDPGGGPAPAARAPAPAPAAAAPDSATAASQDDLDTYLEAARGTDLPPDIRLWAVAQLGGIDDPRSTAALVDALGDEDARVVAAAVTAVVGRRDDPRVAEALAELHSHRDPAVQAALAALGEES